VASAVPFDMPHRCICGGSGVDGCPRRVFFEVLGRDPTWRHAVQADVGRSFGLRDSIARDAFAGSREIPRSQRCEPLALPAPPPFVISDLLNERTYQRDA
jgi:hypothetical protein